MKTILSILITVLFLQNTFAQTPDSWQEMQSLGTSITTRTDAVGFSIGNKGYIGTGGGRRDFFEYDPTTDVWTQKADFGGTSRYGATGFSIGGKGYIGTGYGDSEFGFIYKKDFWEYDPLSNTWTRKVDFGGAGRYNATGFGIGSKGYIGTGGTGSYPNDDIYFNDFWEYDPATNAWLQIADFGGAGRYNATGFGIGSKGYLGTGSPGYGTLKDFWEYSPATNVWTQKAYFAGTARTQATGFSTVSRGYIGMGHNLTEGDKIDFWEYDPASNHWSKKTDFPGTGLAGATAFSIGNKGYIGGSSIDFFEYNSETNTWTRKADFDGTSRSGAVGFSIGSKGYLGTGSSPNGYLKKDFWEFDPYTNAWTQKADFGGGARTGATAFSIGSKGYIGTGSITGLYGLKDFWEYDPITNVWIRKADFGFEITRATSFSINGKGYIGTGFFDGFYYINSFWEYNPITDVWTPKEPFSGEGRSSAAGFNIGGKGYIGTGIGSGGYNLRDFWEYDPVTNKWTQRAAFGGEARFGATGFSIGGKGYIGTGNARKDFWEYDPLTNLWTQKVDFGGGTRSGATGFSIGNFGYIGFGSLYGGEIRNDWWQYTPSIPDTTPVILTDVTNIAATKAVAHWYPVAGAISYSVCVARTDSLKYSCYIPVTDTLKQLINLLPATQYNVKVKAIFGVGDSSVFSVPYTFTTTDTCIAPSNLKVTNITAVAAKLSWKLPLVPVAGFQINYRAVGAGNWIKKQKPYPNTSISITGLTASTNYEWRILSGCTSSQSAFASGPNFTTLSAVNYASTTDGIEGISATENLGIKVIPNPGNGDFTMQVALPAKAAVTTLLLYNNMGQKVWQQNAGNIGGRLNRDISLRNILSNGVYLFVIERNDIKLSQKIVISK